MSDTTFVNGVTLTDADWFNDQNRLGYTIFGDPSTVSAALTALLAGTGNAPLILSGASGGQIVFPASQNASANANTLDDYEEGTCTLGVSFGGGTTGLVYGSQAGKYTKIGNSVTVVGSANINDNGSSTGAALVTGLPFTISNTTGVQPVASVVLASAAAGVITAPTALGVINTTTAALGRFEAGTNTALAETDIPNGTTIYFTIKYMV